MSNIIQILENEQMQAAKAIPAFGPGDTLVVQVKVKVYVYSLTKGLSLQSVTAA